MSRRISALSASALLASVLLLISSAPAAAKHRHGPGRLGPIEGRLHVGRGDEQSTNWSGYAAYGTTFTSVSGNWLQPQANCNLKGHQVALSAFWVGLDGYNNKTVEQTGTEADCEGKEAVYYAWYELYPERLFLIPIKAEPGNEFHAEVTQSTLFLKNVTTGEEKTVNYSSGSLEFVSAEWIAEKPFSRFSDFGEVHFTGASARDESGEHSVQEWEPNLDSIELVSGRGRKSTVLAEPTGLSGGGFSIVQTP